MPPPTSEQQFQFLISCIRHSDNGKINFDEVKKECNIVSKGAASKRFERMMKAHNIPSNGSKQVAGKPSSSFTSARSFRVEKSNGRATSRKTKKHGFDDAGNGEDIDDDEEDFDTQSQSGNDAKVEGCDIRVKDELAQHDMALTGQMDYSLGSLPAQGSMQMPMGMSGYARGGGGNCYGGEPPFGTYDPYAQYAMPSEYAYPSPQVYSSFTAPRPTQSYLRSDQNMPVDDHPIVLD